MSIDRSNKRPLRLITPFLVDKAEQNYQILRRRQIRRFLSPPSRDVAATLSSRPPTICAFSWSCASKRRFFLAKARFLGKPLDDFRHDAMKAADIPQEDIDFPIYHRQARDKHFTATLPRPPCRRRRYYTRYKAHFATGHRCRYSTRSVDFCFSIINTPRLCMTEEATK